MAQTEAQVVVVVVVTAPKLYLVEHLLKLD
jgi:hypothetical protein